eukprot:1372584-Rhodomonas_salina.1
MAAQPALTLKCNDKTHASARAFQFYAESANDDDDDDDGDYDDDDHNEDDEDDEEDDEDHNEDDEDDAEDEDGQPAERGANLGRKARCKRHARPAAS